MTLRKLSAAVLMALTTFAIVSAKAEAQTIWEGLPKCTAPGLLLPVPPYCDPTPQLPPTLPTVQCGQSSTAGIGPRPYTDRFLPGTIVYGAGVVFPGTRISFSVVDQNNQVVLRHTTAPARDNCVVHHEPEAISTAGLAPGVYRVLAEFTAWENSARTVQQFNVFEILSPPPSTSIPEPDLEPEYCDGSIALKKLCLL